MDRMVAVKDAVHKVQLYLFEGIEDENQLFAAGSLMCRDDYKDVVTERTIARNCGYPLCRNALPAEKPRKGKYRISLKEHKVYDLQETYSYCSTTCVVNSRAFAGFLPDERSSDLKPAKLTEILRLFQGSSLDSKEDTAKMGDLGLSKLSIQEKTNPSKEVSFEEWLGPSGAIEGYVPQKEPKSKPRHQESHSKGSNSKAKASQTKNENHITFSDMDFASTIITQDEYCVSKMPGSTNTPSSKTSKSSNRKEHCKDNKRLSKASQEPNMSVGSPSDGNSQKSNNLNGDEDVKGKGFEISELVRAGKALESAVVELKSSLKSSNSKKLNRSVTWAEEEMEGNSTHPCEYEASKNSARVSVAEVEGSDNPYRPCEYEASKNSARVSVSEVEGNDNPYRPCEYEASKNSARVSVLEVEGNDNPYRLASAEAIADSLMQVADVVASGKTDVSSAVSEVGLIILPPPQDSDGSTPQEDDDDEHEENPVHSKWPSKPGEPNFDLFDSDDSWFDGPPNGFNLELSPFATMFTALFAWISSSSLAYIYGRDGSFHEEYSTINGRDYPSKVVALDGRSSEIQLTLAGCLSRALPGVVRDLRLPTPVSTLEQGMSHLLDTMSFIESLPGFRMKQWQVIVLLFLDALSVSRIPALTPYMTGRRVLLPKVLDGASIKAEEYEIMKDLIIPLGRAPQFSSQSGG